MSLERRSAAALAERLSIGPLRVGPLRGRARRKLREVQLRHCMLPEAS